MALKREKQIEQMYVKGNMSLAYYVIDRMPNMCREWGKVDVEDSLSLNRASIRLVFLS